MPVPNAFVADTDALASEVNDNFDYITDLIDAIGETTVIEVDASVNQARITDVAGTRTLYFGSNASNPYIGTFTNHDLRIIVNNAQHSLFGTDGAFAVFNGGSYTRLKHDGSNATVDTNTGALILTGASGIVRTGSAGELRAYQADNTNFAYMNQQGTDYAAFGSFAGDVLLAPSADGQVVRLQRHPRRNYSSNTYVDSHIQSGWGYIAGAAADHISASVTFPVAYSSDNVRVIVGHGGVRPTASGAPSDEGDSSGPLFADEKVVAYSITTTGFEVAFCEEGTNLDNTVYYLYHWISIGPN